MVASEIDVMEAPRSPLGVTSASLQGCDLG
jgi:hypothetical protein